MGTTGGRQLLDALAKQGRKQTWLARELGVHPQTVWFWAHDEGRPSVPRRLRIQALLGVPAAAWLTPAERGESEAA